MRIAPVAPDKIKALLLEYPNGPRSFPKTHWSDEACIALWDLLEVAFPQVFSEAQAQLYLNRGSEPVAPQISSGGERKKDDLLDAMRREDQSWKNEDQSWKDKERQEEMDWPGGG